MEENSPDKKEIAVIIGAGPAGLTAAYELLTRTSIIPIVIEKSAYVGGLSATINYEGNRIDIGGHRFFTKSDQVLKWWLKFLPISQESNELVLKYKGQTKSFEPNKYFAKDPNSDAVMMIRSRKSRILYRGKLFDYPITISLRTILNLGIFECAICAWSYLASILFSRKENTLEDFLINRFGKRLYQRFFKEYTEKVWGKPCSQIPASWGAQRIKGLSIFQVLCSAIKKAIFGNYNRSNHKQETSLIEYFLYPRFGPGQMWESVAQEVTRLGGSILLNTQIESIKLNARNHVSEVIINSSLQNKEQKITPQYLFSSAAISDLVKFIGEQIPLEVAEIASNLEYREFITVGLLLDQCDPRNFSDTWIYVQTPGVKVGRIQIFNNWSPYLVKDKSKLWIGLEFFCSEDEELWKADDKALIQLAEREFRQIELFPEDAAIINSCIIRSPKSYPSYSGSYKDFDKLKTFLDSIENLFLIGRNGMHRYNNQDHSMLTAMQAVTNIVDNIKLKDNIWAINTEEEYHET